ncbi:MAG: hypothetical protein AAF585_11465 [Verrucomicrobiota bacterium]
MNIAYAATSSASSSNEEQLSYDPYKLKHPNGTVLEMGFQNLDEVIRFCSDPSTEPGNDNDVLGLHFVFPGNLELAGYPTDILCVNRVFRSLTRLCYRMTEHKDEGERDIEMTKEPGECASWEADFESLKHVESKRGFAESHVHDLDELSHIYPEFTRKRHESKEEWIKRCFELMKNRQIEMQKQAHRILSENNLVVLGSPEVNSVNALFTDFVYDHLDCVGELGMYTVPRSGQLPMTLKRNHRTQEAWKKWNQDSWADNQIGWLQMVANPWAKSKPRFMIIAAGFRDHGTQAALMKLVEIIQHTRHCIEKKGPTFSKSSRMRLDFQRGIAEDDRIPAHVVEAVLPEPPLWWFWRANRKDRKWTTTPTSLRGSIIGHRPVPASDHEGFENPLDKVPVAAETSDAALEPFNPQAPN